MITYCPIEKSKCSGCPYGDDENLDCMHPEYSENRVYEHNGMTEIKSDDIISHPSHYCEGRKYEPKDVIADWDLDFFLGSAVKYIARAGRKPGNSKEQDLRKAIQYLKFEIEKGKDK